MMRIGREKEQARERERDKERKKRGKPEIWTGETQTFQERPVVLYDSGCCCGDFCRIDPDRFYT